MRASPKVSAEAAEADPEARVAVRAAARGESAENSNPTPKQKFPQPPQPDLFVTLSIIQQLTHFITYLNITAMQKTFTI